MTPIEPGRMRPARSNTLVDALFDIRTGYHVVTKPAGWFDEHPLGEGNPEVFTIIRCREEALPEFLREPEEEGGECIPVCKLSRAAHIEAQENTSVDAPIANIHDASALITEAASLEDLRVQTAALDTRRNSILTVLSLIHI